MRRQAARLYQQVSLESASPTRILDELYLRLSNDIGDARRFIKERDAAAKGSSINHAQSIVAELTAALDHSVAPKLCGELASLYNFVSGRLTAANLQFDVAPLDEAERVLLPLREGFRGAAGRR